jgi:uncharacterized protein (DUF1501 family)
MIDFPRRSFLKFAAAGAGTLMVPRLPAWAAPAATDPHFFLLIMLGGGADVSYTYDARPLSMTAAGRIQNYVGKEPLLIKGRNGGTLRASPLTQPLGRLQDRFSVLNGVVMTPSFDGHLQNMNFLLTGDAFGGESFVPHLNLATAGRPAGMLDAIVPSNAIVSNVTNDSRMVPLHPQSAGGLSSQLKNIAPFRAGDELMDFVRGRIAANAAGRGRFVAGAARMDQALAVAGDMHAKLATLTPPDESLPAEDKAVALLAQCFQLGIARSGVYLVPEFFDTHAPEEAARQPQLFASAIDRIVTFFDGLIETPYDDKRSMLDVTTVMVASEFSRTLRSPDHAMDATGTNHNQYCNTILLGGKGVRPGLVIGASDLADEKEAASPAHLALDPNLERIIGRPFDFKTMLPRADKSNSFDLRDHLTVASVINTVYSMFGVPEERWRMLGRDLPVAPLLSGLRT